MSHIFISYGHEDKAYTEKLTEALESLYFDVWIDKKIAHGSEWRQVIQDKIDACDAFVIVMSPHSYGSHWVQNELARAQDKGKPIFPLLLEGDGPWFSVQSIQYVDVRDGKLPSVNFYSQLAQASLQTMEKRGEKLPTLVRLSRMITGRDLMSPGLGTFARIFDHDEPRDEADMEQISDFIQYVSECFECVDELESGDRVKMAFSLSRKISDLESCGLYVYSGRTQRDVNCGGLGVAKDVAVAVVILSYRNLEFVMWFSQPN